MRTSRLLFNIVSGVACTIFTTGCFLLPSEDVSHNIVIETEAKSEYNLAAVIRGDVVSGKTVYCTYTETVEDEYSFAVGDLSVKYVYVSVGDKVSKGDLLAKLDTSGADAQYDALSYEIERVTLQLKQCKELRDFDLKALTASYRDGTLSKTDYENRTDATKNQYQSQIDGYEETLYIDGLRLDQVKTVLDGSAIYAAMDGTVSYVTSNLQDSFAKAGNTVIRVVDDTQCAFEIEDKTLMEYFTDGQEITVTDASGNAYDTTVMTKVNEDGSETVFFMLEDPDAGLSVGTRVSYELIFNEAKDVLMLPTYSIHCADNRFFVYTQDENGIKTLKYITIGLKGNTYTEVTDGIELGELVIQ